MELILALCTILGGISAVWFFWEKINKHWQILLNLFRRNREISPLSLPDDEFMLIEKITKFNDKSCYYPTLDREIQLCNSLVNHGVLIKQADSSFRPTKEGKELLRISTDT